MGYAPSQDITQRGVTRVVLTLCHVGSTALAEEFGKTASAISKRAVPRALLTIQLAFSA